MEMAYSFYRFEKMLNITDLISLFYCKSPKNFRFTGESHDFWELIYIDKGQMLITAGEQQYILKAGELAFHRPREFHAVEAYENIPANFIVCAFDCRSQYMNYFEHKILPLNGFARECLYAAVRETKSTLPCILHIPGSPFGSSQMIQSYLEQMLVTLYRQNSDCKIQQRVESFEQKNSYKQLTANVKAYLEEHTGERLTMAQISKALNYSVSQMKKFFKAETGDSVIAYLINLKMDEAKRMIREGNESFTQIAARLGYDDVHYFSRLFKLKNDMTPTEYSRSIG